MTPADLTQLLDQHWPGPWASTGRQEWSLTLIPGVLRASVYLCHDPELPAGAGTLGLEVRHGAGSWNDTLWGDPGIEGGPAEWTQAIDRTRAHARRLCLEMAKTLDLTLVHAPEPPPGEGEGDVWAEVIAMLRETGASPELVELARARRAFGIEKYGQALQRRDGRDHAKDESEELLDAAAYRAARAGADHPQVRDYLEQALSCLREADDA